MVRNSRSVTQENSFGCGIACVAFICKTDYKTAKKKFFKSIGDSDNTGYFCKDLVKALLRAGKNYHYRYIKKKQKFKENTIVFLRRSKRYPRGHYIVKTENGWMDPWINFKVDKPDVNEANSGFRGRLPEKAIYAILPE